MLDLVGKEFLASVLANLERRAEYLLPEPAPFSRRGRYPTGDGTGSVSPLYVANRRAATGVVVPQNITGGLNGDPVRRRPGGTLPADSQPAASALRRALLRPASDGTCGPVRRRLNWRRNPCATSSTAPSVTPIKRE